MIRIPKSVLGKIHNSEIKTEVIFEMLTSIKMGLGISDVTT